jgi:hypothetical protein
MNAAACAWRQHTGNGEKKNLALREKKDKDAGANATNGMTSSAPEKIVPKMTLEQLRALPRFEPDFDTPEGAILCLEDACRRRNIESAVACKDFSIEGILMLMNYDPDLARDPEVRKRNALLAERAYRREITESWPDLDGAESFFIARQSYLEGIAVVTELRRLRDGSFDKLNLLVAKTRHGWRVLNPVSDDELKG